MQVELMSITPNAEDVIERACRTCYLSFHRYHPPKSTEELIKKVITKGHHSVLEHAMATFRIKGGYQSYLCSKGTLGLHDVCGVLVEIQMIRDCPRRLLTIVNRDWLLMDLIPAKS